MTETITTAPPVVPGVEGVSGGADTPGGESGLLGLLARGTSWGTANQLIPLAVNVAITPFVLHTLGRQAYGLFLLCTTLTAFLGTLDLGLGAAAARFAAVYLGRRDRVAAADMVLTMVALVSGLGLAAFLVVYAYAGDVLSIIGVPGALHGSAQHLLRVLAVTIGAGQLTNVLAGQLAAHRRFAMQSIASTVSYLGYAIVVVLTLRDGRGLGGLADALLVQSLLAVVLTAPAALRPLPMRRARLMRRSELRSFAAIAMGSQVNGVTALVTAEADAMIVGTALPVGALASYGPGANFATQLRFVPVNALGPIASILSRAYGSGGDAGAQAVFGRLQRYWVLGVTAWGVVGCSAAYFGVVSWLGPHYRDSGVVASILLCCYTINLWTGVLTVLLTSVGRPGLETRYLIVCVALNLGLTVPLVLWQGLFGTVAATAIAAVAASLYLQRLVHRRYEPDLPSFLREVPVAASAAAAATVIASELLVRPVMPSGPFGLIGCGLAAAPGFLAFAAVLLGWAASRDVVTTLARERSARAVITLLRASVER